jgi:hypothetical protein
MTTQKCHHYPLKARKSFSTTDERWGRQDERWGVGVGTESTQATTYSNVNTNRETATATADSEPTGFFLSTATHHNNNKQGKHTTMGTMEDLREMVATVINPALPAFPPQRGFKVGDVLLLNRNENPALSNMRRVV